MDPASDSTDGDELLLGLLLEEFTARLRAGERPDVEEFVARHAQQAAAIRELLGTAEALERTTLRRHGLLQSSVNVSRIGDYRIERELGRGGMGVVFLATDERLGRQVALKLLPVQATLDARFLERFRREARAAAGLQHAHIVPVYGVGEHEGLHYYAMQYVEGHTLDELARSLRERGPQPVDSHADAGTIESLALGLETREVSSDSGSHTLSLAGGPAPGPRAPAPSPTGRRATYHKNIARLGLHVARALSYAHTRGILHRDVKPANLLLDESGHVWITDFGLCATADDSRVTTSLDLIGTLRYMSPEQLEGRADVQSDVYGLGVTLYELLTLQPAFDGRDRAALMKRVIERSPIRPRRIDPAIPPDLEAIVLKATAKLPEERYGTAQALAEDLLAFLEGRAIAARPPGAIHLVRLAIRRNRILAATVATASSLLLLASVLYLIGIARARAAGVRQLYLANVATATASIDVDPHAARRALELAPREHRNWEWQHLRARVDQSLAQVAVLGERTGALDITQDGALLVATAQDRVVVLDLLAGAAPRFSAPLSSAVLALDTHPDGTRAVVAQGNELALLDLAALDTLALRQLDAPLRAVRFDPSGSRIYVALSTGLIRCFDAELEDELFVLRGHAGPVEDLAIAPDGRLISAGLDRTVRLWDPDSREGRVVDGYAAELSAVDVSPDGSLLASLEADGRVRLLELESGQQVATWRASAMGTVLRFSPDGRFVVSGSDDRALLVWDVLDGSPRLAATPFALDPPPIRLWETWRDHAVRTLVGNDVFASGLAFHPDGRLFSAGYDGAIRLWDIGASGGLLVLTGHISDVWGLAFDATGTRLVSSSRDATVRVWDAETGRQLCVLFSGSVPYGVSFSPDGREAAALCRDGALRIWDVESGEQVAELVCPRGGAGEQIQGCVGYDPSGERLFVSAYELGFDAWARAADGWRLEHHEAVEGAFSTEVSPDGSSVAVGTMHGRLRVLDTTHWTTRFEVQAHAGRIRSLAFRRDGRLLASAGPDGLARTWSVPSGKLERTLPVRTAYAFESDIEGIEFSPDGSRLACVLTGSGVALWDPVRGEHVTTLQGPGRGYNQVVFDPTGRRLASGSWGGEIRIWDTITAGERRLALGGGARAGSPGRARAGQESFATLLFRARGLLRSGQLDAASTHEARWIGRGIQKGHPVDPRANAVYGEALYRAGELQEAAALLEAAVQGSEQLGRPSFDALAFLAMALARTGRLDEARAAGDRARRLLDDAATHGVLTPQDLMREAEQWLSATRVPPADE